MTTVSLNFRKESYAAETGHVPIMLITFNHVEMAFPIRLSTDPTQRVVETDSIIGYGTISRGETYAFMPMRLKLPDDTDSGPGDMQIELDNVDRVMVATIRNIHSPLNVRVEIVMSNAIDTVDLVWPEYILTNIQYNATTITGTMTLENLTREPFPGLIFTPSTAPGIFLS